MSVRAASADHFTSDCMFWLVFFVASSRFPWSTHSRQFFASFVGTGVQSERFLGPKSLAMRYLHLPGSVSFGRVP